MIDLAFAFVTFVLLRGHLCKPAVSIYPVSFLCMFAYLRLILFSRPKNEQNRQNSQSIQLSPFVLILLRSESSENK